jgi:glycosyltransferase involved in cell wall biosynthesis
MERKQPYFSIIIPTYERPRQLATCLKSLTRLEYPSDLFEVIVVDDGNKAPLDRIVAPFCNRIKLILIRQLNSGPAAARNTGAVRANGKFLAFTDDDCRPSPNWLQALSVRFANEPESIIGGRTLNTLLNNLYSTMSQVITDAVYDYYNNDSDQEHFFTTNNLSLPADRFRAVGGFDTTFPLAAGEDREFCDRWLQHGYPMIYAPEVVINHAHVLSFRSFLKQRLNYGRGAFLFQQARVQRDWGRVKVDPKFYFHLFRYPFLQRGCRRVLLFETLLVASYMAYTAGFLWEKVNRTDRRSAGKSPQL